MTTSSVKLAEKEMPVRMVLKKSISFQIFSVLENSTPPLESGPEQEVSRRVERMRRRSLFMSELCNPTLKKSNSHLLTCKH
jgi:hypothetical protein